MSKLSKNVSNLIAHDMKNDSIKTFKTLLSDGYAEFSMYECDAQFYEDQNLTMVRRPLEGVPNSVPEEITPTSGAWFSLQFSGEPLLRFEEIIDYILQQQCRLEIELSAAEGEDAYALGQNVVALLRTKTLAHFNKGLDAFLEIGVDSILERLYDHLLENPSTISVKRQFLISSKDPEILRGAMESVPEIPRALIVADDSRSAAEINALLTLLECRGVMIKQSTFTDELNNIEFDEDRFMMLYQMNDDGNVERLLVVGVDNIIIQNKDEIAYIHWLPVVA